MDTLLRTSNLNLIGLEIISRSKVPILSTRRIVSTRESYFDIVLVFQAGGIFAVLTDQRPVVIVSNLEDFGSFVGLSYKISALNHAHLKNTPT